jgi:nitroreductase
MKLIENLNWRYATKSFDPDKKVSRDVLENLMEAIRLSVSSYGLQLYKVLIIENPEIRKELRKASWDQAQITDASHLFVFCNYTRDYDQQVDDFIGKILDNQQGDREGPMNYGQSIKKNIRNMTDIERSAWSEKQTYLALNNLLIACAELRIDACPMEGFDNDSYDSILGLNEMGLHASVIASVGFRSADDHTQYRKKIRKTKEELFQMA